MQETFYQTADAEVSLSDCGCRKHSIRQLMQKPLVKTADAGNTFITQRMQETLYQTADAEVSITQRMQESLNQKTNAGDTLSDAAAV